MITAVESPEGIRLHQMIPKVEAELDPDRYAHRRDRGTEMALAGMPVLP